MQETTRRPPTAKVARLRGTTDEANAMSRRIGDDLVHLDQRIVFKA